MPGRALCNFKDMTCVRKHESMNGAFAISINFKFYNNTLYCRGILSKWDEKRVPKMFDKLQGYKISD